MNDEAISYETAIRARAERLGAEVIDKPDGLVLVTPDGGYAFHRLGGDAEDRHDVRQSRPGDYPEPGRWCAPPVSTSGAILWSTGAFGEPRKYHLAAV